MLIPEPVYKNLAIISEIPKDAKTILDVGCGHGSLGRWLIDKGLEVYGLDLEPQKELGYTGFAVGDIQDRSTVPFPPMDCVIGSEVLEHVADWRIAAKNMCALARSKVIITIPWKTSFNDPGHTVHWSGPGNDTDKPEVESSHSAYVPIEELLACFTPCKTHIRRSITTGGDRKKNESVYVITVDK